MLQAFKSLPLLAQTWILIAAGIPIPVAIGFFIGSDQALAAAIIEIFIVAGYAGWQSTNSR